MCYYNYNSKKIAELVTISCVGCEQHDSNKTCLTVLLQVNGMSITDLTVQY